MSRKLETKLLKSPQDVQRLLAEMINGVLSGDIDPEAANSIGNLSGHLLKTLERTSLEDQVARLEAQLSRYEQERNDNDPTERIEPYRT